MNKTLVTKLAGIVENNDLLKLGEMRIFFSVDETPKKASRNVNLAFNEDVTVEVVGGYFTNNTLTENNGNTFRFSKNVQSNLVVSNSDCYIKIPNKYALTKIGVNTLEGNNLIKSTMRFDVEALKYSKGIVAFNVMSTSVYGDISNLSIDALTEFIVGSSNVYGDIAILAGNNKLSRIDIQNTSLYGDIGVLRDFNLLDSLNLSSTNVSGDISALSGLTGLTYLNFSHTNVSGDISALSGLTGLTTLLMRTSNVSGDLGSLSRITKLSALNIRDTKISGDISSINSSIPFLSFDKMTGIFTWKNTRSSSLPVIAMESYPNLGTDVDAMLTNQANCAVGFSSSSPDYYKVITATGTRTSASDAAVQTLQSKGYTVSITPA